MLEFCYLMSGALSEQNFTLGKRQRVETVLFHIVTEVYFCGKNLH